MHLISLAFTILLNEMNHSGGLNTTPLSVNGHRIQTEDEQVNTDQPDLTDICRNLSLTAVEFTVFSLRTSSWICHMLSHKINLKNTKIKKRNSKPYHVFLLTIWNKAKNW